MDRQTNKVTYEVISLWSNTYFHLFIDRPSMEIDVLTRFSLMIGILAKISSCLSKRSVFWENNKMSLIYLKRTYVLSCNYYIVALHYILIYILSIDLLECYPMLQYIERKFSIVFLLLIKKILSNMGYITKILFYLVL